jgi:hypothetical protein
MSDIWPLNWVERTATIHGCPAYARIGTKNATMQVLFATAVMANLVTDSSSASRRPESFPQELAKSGVKARACSLLEPIRSLLFPLELPLVLILIHSLLLCDPFPLSINHHPRHIHLLFTRIWNL